MKVGTLNFHRSQNYGVLMVTYALLTYLKRIGIDAQAIDYFPEHHTRMYPVRNEAYYKFIDKHLRPFGSAEDVYDLIIYGADTIWEYYKDYGYDDTYWGSDRLKSKKKMTFSASGTMKNFSKESDALFRKYLDKFYAISVREDVLAEYLKRFTFKPITHTCDPTFLLTKEDYSQIMSERLISGEYTVIYDRQLGAKLFEVAKTVQKKTGLQTVVLKGDGCLYNTDAELLCSDIGPSEFLSLIADSSYVLAASFHAVAFSIIFKKQFHTIMKSGTERVESLLRKAGLQDRRIEHSREIQIDSPIDYSALFSMEDYIECSKIYLNSALHEINCQVDATNKEAESREKTRRVQRNTAYIWGAAKYGKEALEYCKDKFSIIGFIDKRADTGFHEFCSKPVLSPLQFLSNEKNGNSVIIAVSYPVEIVGFIETHCAHVNTFIFDGRNRENSLLYKVQDGEICVPEYMDKRFAEWEEYSDHYKQLNPFVFKLFYTALMWMKKQDKEIEICEIGCGSGQFANMLFDNGYLEYIGIDFSSKAIDLARKTNPQYVSKFICGDAFSCLQAREKNGNTLFIMFEVLEHINKNVALLNMLPSGSEILFSVPNFKSFNHVRTFTSLEAIKDRYDMLNIWEYLELPASKITDKVYHLVFATKY